MIRVIIDNPHGSWPKFPRVVEAENREELDEQVKRSLAGFRAYFGAERAAKTTVTEITSTADLTGDYIK